MFSTLLSLTLPLSSSSTTSRELRQDLKRSLTPSASRTFSADSFLPGRIQVTSLRDSINHFPLSYFIKIVTHKIDNSHIIITGDFNRNVDKIRTGASRPKDPSEKYFTKLMSSFNLLNMSYCHPDKPGFTYTPTARRTFYGSRGNYKYTCWQEDSNK